MRSIVCILVCLLAHASLGSALLQNLNGLKHNLGYGYHSHVGFKLATEIRQAEEESFKLSQKQGSFINHSSKIVVDFIAKLEDFPYHI